MSQHGGKWLELMAAASFRRGIALKFVTVPTALFLLLPSCSHVPGLAPVGIRVGDPGLYYEPCSIRWRWVVGSGQREKVYVVRGDCGCASPLKTAMIFPASWGPCPCLRTLQLGVP